MSLHLLVLCVIVALICQQTEARPPYIECASSHECGTMACCVIGMGKFSVPTCKSFSDIGDTCNPYPELLNTSLTYPDGETVEFTNVFRLFCPCAEGLMCGDDAACYDPALGVDDNYILDY